MCLENLCDLCIMHGLALLEVHRKGINVTQTSSQRA